MRTTTAATTADELRPESSAFYRHAMQVLKQGGIPFLVGGAYAMARYTGIVRHTKDLDLFVRPEDCGRALDRLAAAGYQTELTFSHWLGKAFNGDDFLDIIFSSGNGVVTVDDGWLEHAVPSQVLGEDVWLCPVEESIWSKAYVCERERFDGADIHHLLRARGPVLDWSRLLARFADHWRLLLSHLVVFGFVYPADRDRVPGWVMAELLGRMNEELRTPTPESALCHGPLLSRTQYLIDLRDWGYEDARLHPHGNMAPEEVRHWTAVALEKK